MSEKKILKREVKAVWDAVKELRAERGKSYAPADVQDAAGQLAAHAEKLADLSGKLSALNAMPPDALPPSTQPKARRSKTKG